MVKNKGAKTESLGQKSGTSAETFRDLRTGETTLRPSKIVAPPVVAQEQIPSVVTPTSANSNVNAAFSSSSAEYRGFFRYLESEIGPVSDLLLDKYGEHPVTYGDVASASEITAEFLLKEGVLTTKSVRKDIVHCMQSVDKIFFFPGSDSSIGKKRDNKAPAERSNYPRVVDVDVCINPMKVTCEMESCRKTPLTHLSDHYAVEATVTIEKKSNVLVVENSMKS